MNIDKELAMKLWDDIYPNQLYARDCFGGWMYKGAYSKEPYFMNFHLNPCYRYDYSWNIDHIRPKASFKNEANADFYNNFELMNRNNNLEKSDNYPEFVVNNKRYSAVPNGQYGYGIIDSSGRRIDWKAVTNRCYK